MSWLQCRISCLILSGSNRNSLCPRYLQHLYSTSKLPPTFPFTNSSWNPSVHSHAWSRTKHTLSTQLKAPSSSPTLQDTSTYSFNTYTPPVLLQKTTAHNTQKLPLWVHLSFKGGTHTHTHIICVQKPTGDYV